MGIMVHSLLLWVMQDVYHPGQHKNENDSLQNQTGKETAPPTMVMATDMPAVCIAAPTTCFMIHLMNSKHTSPIRGCMFALSSSPKPLTATS